MIDALKLQADVVTWHKTRFPHAEMVHVALKLAEESGEVASAINALEGANSATGEGDVVGELADVLIVSMVLLGRWFPDADLLAEVTKKLAVLNDPTSGHRASLISVGNPGGGDPMYMDSHHREHDDYIY